MRIGPTFTDDLIAAGVSLSGIGWTPGGGIYYADSVDQTTRNKVAAVLAAHDATKPDPRLLYSASIAAGLAIMSPATPALNGTYAIDEAAQQRISGIYAGIKGGDGLPGGGSTFNYPDISGAMHAFTATDFTDFAKAVRDHLYALSQGGSPTSETIA